MTKIYGILGYPVEHSLSPAMHNAAFKAEGIDAEYRRFEINPDDGEELANFCYETDLNDIQGFSVTMPYKERIMDFLDYYDPIAKKLKSVNTVKNEESNLSGYNSDVTGAVQTLKEQGGVSGLKALVLGAGGAARAIIYGLKEFGAEVSIYNRTRKKAKDLAQEMEVDLCDLRDIQKGAFDIIVNATPIGSAPHIEQCLITQDDIKEGAVVMDIVTHPLETELLKMAKRAGAKTISGERMLLHQAAGQFEIWFDKSAPFEVMEKALYEELKKRS